MDGPTYTRTCSRLMDMLQNHGRHYRRHGDTAATASQVNICKLVPTAHCLLGLGKLLNSRSLSPLIYALWPLHGFCLTVGPFQFDPFSHTHQTRAIMMRLRVGPDGKRKGTREKYRLECWMEYLIKASMKQTLS